MSPVQAPYYAGWEQSALPPASLPWDKMTHVIHFSLLPTANGGLDDTTNGVTATRSGALIAEAHRRGKKVLISVGGTPGSEHWPTAASATHRGTFVANLVNLMSSRGYDGIDLNWEGSVSNADYVATMQALRAALDRRGRGELLTAVYYGSWTGLAKASHPLLDWVSMMTYLPYGQPANSHNSSIYGSTYARIDNLVGLWLSAGVPREKIVFGFATYASVWSNGGLGAAEMPYRDAVARGYTTGMRWDAAAATSYWQSGDTFVSLENETSIREKVAYRQAKGLRGLIVWELGAGRVGTTVPLAASLPSVPDTVHRDPAPTVNPSPAGPSPSTSPSPSPTSTASAPVVSPTPTGSVKRPPGALKKR
jgi:chitinase